MSVNNESEPLDQNYSPDRVFYAFGRMLSVQDFDDEQTYHRGRLARAMAYLEGSGTVAGLKVLYQGGLVRTKKSKSLREWPLTAWDASSKFHARRACVWIAASS